MNAQSGKTGRYLASYKNNKKKIEITLSDQSKLAISKQTFLEFNLYINKPVEESLLNELQEFEEYSSALNYSIKLLNRFSYNSFKLREKLINKKVNKKIIVKVINYLISKNLINDEQYLIDYIELSLNKFKGFNYIKAKLLTKGFNSSLIDKYLSKYNEEDYIYEFISLLIKRFNNKDDIKEFINHKLINAGYTYPTINNAINKALKDSIISNNR